MEEKKIYLDEEGYIAHTEAIKNLRNNYKKIDDEIKKLRDLRNEDYLQSVTNLKITQKGILNRMNKMIDDLNYIEIVKTSGNEEIVDINDRVNLTLIFSDNETEEIELQLIANGKIDLKACDTVSINSPLGKSIYKKVVGTTSSFKVNGEEVLVTINSKIKNKTK